MMKYFDFDVVPVVKDGKRFLPEFNTDAVLSMLENDALVQNLPAANLTFEGDTLFLYGSKGFFDL